MPLRLIVGLGFLEHGYAKLYRGADAFIAILHAMGIPFADVLGWATIAVEIVGGLLILLAAFVPLAAAPMIVVLLVAIFTVHLANGFSSNKLLSYDAAGARFGQPGFETDLLYIAALLSLCVGGPGPLSVDGYLNVRVRHAPGWRRRSLPAGGATFGYAAMAVAARSSASRRAFQAQGKSSPTRCAG